MRSVISRRRRLILLAYLAALALAACTLGQTPPARRVCTLMACGTSLEIALVGEYVPTDFSMSITSSSGDSVNIRCTNGTAQFDPPEAALWSPACPAGGVTLQDFAPGRLSIKVGWSDGEVTQEFQPAYSESQPNGPDCEPICRTARLELLIPAMPAYGDASTWETYIDRAHGFSLRHPAALPLEFGPQVDGDRIVLLGDQIQVRASPIDPLVCQGDCPMIESSEPVSIAGRQAHLAHGYVGSIGGNIPQRFMLYRIRSGSTYITLTLFAASRNATVDSPSGILPLQESDIELFNRIVQTLEFLP